MSSTRRTTESTLAVVGFIGVIAVMVVPLMWFDHVPTEDGPAHTALASVVAQLITSSNAAFDHFYVLDVFPAPNLLGTAALVVLQTVFSPSVAERVMFAGVIIALAAAVRYAIGGVARGGTILAILAVPLGIGLIAQLGFFNFMVGLVFFAFTIGYWQRHFTSSDADPGWARVVTLGALFLLTYLGHILPFIASVFVPVVVAIVLAVTETSSTSGARVRIVANRSWERLKWIAVALIPSVMLLAVYVAQPDTGVTVLGRNPLSRMAWLATLGELFVSFSRTEIAMASLIAVVFVVCVVLAVRGRWALGRTVVPSDGYLAAAFILGIVYLVVPSQIAGGSGVPERIAIFTFIVGLMWLAAFDVPRGLQLAIVVVTVLATIGLVVVRWPTFEAYDRDVAEYLTATEVVTEGSTVLPLSLIEADSGVLDTVFAYRVHPMAEVGSYVTSISGAVDLNHLHAEYGYSAAHFRPELNPRLLLGVPQGSSDPIYAVPPQVDIEGFEDETGETVDYVLLWGRAAATPETLADPGAVRLLTLLDDAYDLVFVSADRGLMEVYERR